LVAIPPKKTAGVKTGGHLAEAAYRDGLYSLQSQILDGALATTTPEGHWSVAPNMITAPDGGVRDGTRTRTVMGHLPLLFPTGVPDSGELAPISNEYAPRASSNRRRLRVIDALE